MVPVVTPEMDPQQEPSSVSKQDETEEAEKLEIQPFCKCENCHHWTTSVDWCPLNQGKLGLPEKQPVRKNTLNPILREKPLASQPQVYSLYTAPEFSLTGQTYRILVHGQVIPQPIKTVAATYFNEDIQNSLKNLGYVHSKPIQAFAWPAMFRGMNLMMIGSGQCGKTMGYLPVMCTFALQIGEKYDDFSKYKGPLIIILCSNTDRCEEIFDLIRKLIPVSASKKLKIALVTYPSYKMNNIDILITLPQILLENLKSKVFNLKRLCHLVLEDANLMLQDNEADVYAILGVADEMLQHRVCNQAVQVVLTADKWTEKLDALLKKMYWMPMVCFEDCFEAMLYGLAEFEIKFLNKADKKNYVYTALKDKYRTHKTIVICEEFEMDALHIFFTKKKIDIVSINDSATKEKIETQKELWESASCGHYKVLLCTSFMLDALITIRDAMWLVHYSFPSTWTRFSKRFAASAACIQTPLKSPENKVQCKSILLFDEDSFSSSSSLKHIRTIDAKLLSRLKTRLPSSYRQLMAGVNYNHELDKINEKVKLCPKLKLFGRCTDVTCDSRHTIQPDSDVQADLPQNGKIKFKVLKFHDVTTYTIQVLEHISLTGEVTEFHAEGRRPLVYESEEMKKRVENALSEKYYAYRDVDVDQESFFFCELEKVIGDDFIEVRLASGRAVHTARKNLYQLPQNFKVVEMYLCNLLPPYKDTSFCRRAKSSVHQVLDKMSYKDVVLTGDVRLQMDNTLWLNNVIELVSISGMEFVKTNLIKSLKFANLVTHDDNQIKLLHQLCRDCKVPLPNYETSKPKTAVTAKLTPQEAFLDKDEISEVCLSCVASPDNFFVRLMKFDSLLKNLEDEIQSLKLKDAASVDVGKYYLALDPQTDEYVRVLVLESDRDEAMCFFVDYGEECLVEKSNIKHIPSKFLYKLPFQAIQCRLYGIEPLFDNWKDEAGDIIHKFLLIPEHDVFRSLFAKVCQTENSSTIRTRKTYSVLLKDGYGDKNVLINKLLLETGVALPTMEDDIRDFELPFRPEEQTSDNEEEWEEEVQDLNEASQNVIESDGKPEDMAELNESDFEFYIDGDVDEYLNRRIGIPINTLLAMEEVEQIKPKDQKVLERKLLAIENAKSQVKDDNRSDNDQCTKFKPNGYLTPEVFWSQTSKLIQLKIMLIGVEDYKINLVRRRILSFSTKLNEKMYELKLTFHKTVEMVKHSGGGQDIKIVLKKAEEVEWSQLTMNQKKLRNVHYEFREDELKDEPQKKFLQLDISDVESDGEDIMYHNTEDQLSDYDKDVISSDSD